MQKDIIFLLKKFKTTESAQLWYYLFLPSVGVENGPGNVKRKRRPRTEIMGEATEDDRGNSVSASSGLILNFIHFIIFLPLFSSIKLIR